MLETRVASDVSTSRELALLQRVVARALAWEWLPLAIILTLQSVVALATLQNTAFEDEALYVYAGRQLLTQYMTGAPAVDPFANYFSGHPDVYPLAAGVLDAIGGLALARLLSLVAMLGATTCVFWIGRHLFTRQVAIFGATTFALQGTVLFLSRLATYDATCLCLLAIATVLAFKLSEAKHPWLAFALGPTLVLGFLAKYAFLLWVPPVLAIVALQTFQARAWRPTATRLLLILVATIASGLLAYVILGPSFIHAVINSTLQRQTTPGLLPVPRITLLGQVISYAGIAVGLAVIGALLVPRRLRLLAWLLVGASILAPTYHLYHDEPVSLIKHLAYGCLFAAPLAGLTIERMIHWQTAHLPHAPQIEAPALQWMTALPVLLIIFALGLNQAQTQYQAWANSEQMVTVMRSLVRPDSGHYLAEDMEVTRFYLQDVSADWQWTGPFWFEYKTKQGQMLYDQAAYVQAIHDGYFDAIELSGGATPALDYALKNELAHSSNYQLVSRIFYKDSYGAGYYYVWRKHAPASAVSK